MFDEGGSGTAVLIGVVLFVFLVAGAGVASAAVGGSFSSSYDGWDDGESTETRGHEIVISGTIEVTGDAAVDPTIVISGSEQTVLDASSVRIFVEGDRSIQFERHVEGDQETGETRVIYQADEIPSGTTLQVEYVTYYMGGAGTGSDEVVVGATDITYQSPGGERQRDTFEATNALENRPDNVIDDYQGQLEEGERLGQIQEYLSYLGGLAVVYIVLKIAGSVVGGGGENGGGGGGLKD